MAVRPFIIAVSDAAPPAVAKRVAGSRIVFTPPWIRSGAQLPMVGRLLHDNPVGFASGPLRRRAACGADAIYSLEEQV